MNRSPICRICAHSADDHGWEDDPCNCCATVDHNGQPIDPESEVES